MEVVSYFVWLVGWLVS